MAQKSANNIERELLTKLYEHNGYFTAAFTKEDLETMSRNIAADYDLLCGTSRDNSVALHELTDEVEMHKAEINRLRRELKNAYGVIESKDKKIDEQRILINQIRLDVSTYSEQLHKMHLQNIALKINHCEQLEDDDYMAVLKTIQDQLNKED